MHVRRLALLAVLAIPADLLAGAQAAEPPSWLCYAAEASRGGSGNAVVDMAVADRFATRRLRLERLRTLCRETSGRGTLEGIRAKLARSRPRQPRVLNQSVEVVTGFGRRTVKLRALDRLLVPAVTVAGTNGNPEPPDDGAPPFTCYVVKGGRAKGVRHRIAVSDGRGERLYDVRRPTRFCVPAEAADPRAFLCHAVTLAPDQPRLATDVASAASALGRHVLRIKSGRELCVPVLQATLPPVLRLEVTPTPVAAIGRERLRFTATAHFAAGGSEDYSGKVVWISRDEGIARVVAASAGGAFVETLAPGETTLSVTDPATGVSSTDSSGDATLAVAWPLEKLLIAPHAVTKTVGDHEDFTVTGVFAGGVTRNLTPRVVYASSAPSVASAPNALQRPSRVHALRHGVTQISAVDPISGIGTADSDANAVLTVAPELSFISIEGDGVRSVFPGESIHLRATGRFADGSTRNLTQRCTWISSEPSVAAATNPEGDRSRIDGLAPGVAFVHCRDARTEKTSLPLRLHVLGDLLEIRVYGSESPADWIENGQALRLTAEGRYEDGGYRNLTQDVTWASRDPGVAVAPNEEGDRSRVVGVAAGTARVFATDPTTGIESNDANVVVLGDLVSLEIRASSPVKIRVGSAWFLRVRGVYENGTVQLGPARLVLESSDPAVAVVDGSIVRGVAPGVVEVTARHLGSGLLSPPITLEVRDLVESITLDPPAATRGIGEWESFTATGHFAGGFTENLTQFLVYASSDPGVAVADNQPGNRSRVRTVGPGTATITATDNATGVSGTAVLTVLPGTIERVTVEPPYVVRNPGNDFSFTAIGHYPDGSTINVTQVVTWTSLLPDVAQGTNEPGNRSRVIAKSPGTTALAALHPTGVSSHDTGDDGVLEVKALAGLALTPAEHEGHAGDVKRYTLVGTFADATTINLTQDAFYWTDDPAVAEADNEPGDRSAVHLVGAGTTTVHGAFADWSSGFPAVMGSAAGAFLTVLP